MDDQLFAFGGDEHDELEQVGGSVGSDDEPSVGIFAEVVNDERVIDRVEDVAVGDAVASGGRMNLHTTLLYYKTNLSVERLALSCQPPLSRDPWPWPASGYRPSSPVTGRVGVAGGPSEVCTLSRRSEAAVVDAIGMVPARLRPGLGLRCTSAGGHSW